MRDWTRTGFLATTGFLIGIRIATLPLSGYSQEYGFLEAYYSTLARDAPIDWTHRHLLYVLVLKAVGNTLGWSEWALRLPSTIAWAATAWPIYALATRLSTPRAGAIAVLVWLTFPLSFILAGKVSPSMMVTAFIAAGTLAAYQRRLLPFLLFLGLATATKPVAVLLLMIPPLLRWRNGVIACLGIGAAGVAAFLALDRLPGIVASIGYYATTWGVLDGYHGLAWFLLIVVLTGSTATLAVLARKPTLASLPLVAILLLVSVVTLKWAYPASPHEYYFLPALPAASILAAQNLPRLRHAAPVIGASFLFAMVASMDNGDFWDTRIRDLSNAHDPQSAGPGLLTLVSWYEHKLVPEGPGLRFSHQPHPACTTIEQHDSPWHSDGPVYVLSCPTV